MKQRKRENVVTLEETNVTMPLRVVKRGFEELFEYLGEFVEELRKDLSNELNGDLSLYEDTDSRTARDLYILDYLEHVLFYMTEPVIASDEE